MGKINILALTVLVSGLLALGGVATSAKDESTQLLPPHPKDAKTNESYKHIVLPDGTVPPIRHKGIANPKTPPSDLLKKYRKELHEEWLRTRKILPPMTSKAEDQAPKAPLPIPDSVKRHAPEDIAIRKAQCLDRSDAEKEFFYFEGVLLWEKQIIPPGFCYTLDKCAPDAIRDIRLQIGLDDGGEQLVYAAGTVESTKPFISVIREGKRYGMCTFKKVGKSKTFYVMAFESDLMLIGENK